MCFCVHACVQVCMYGCTYTCAYARMYVSIYVCKSMYVYEINMIRIEVAGAPVMTSCRCADCIVRGFRRVL